MPGRPFTVLGGLRFCLLKYAPDFRWITVSVFVCVALATPALAMVTPEQKCASYKLKATSKYAAAKAKCYVKSLRADIAVDVDCLVRAEAKFREAFDRAEAPSGCLHYNDDSMIGSKVTSLIADVVGDLACGNGRREGDEVCDDGNLTDGDGCDAECYEEDGFMCSGEPSICSPL